MQQTQLKKKCFSAESIIVCQDLVTQGKRERKPEYHPRDKRKLPFAPAGIKHLPGSIRMSIIRNLDFSGEMNESDQTVSGIFAAGNSDHKRSGDSPKVPSGYSPVCEISAAAIRISNGLSDVAV
jgi:hypothetical protein